MKMAWGDKYMDSIQKQNLVEMEGGAGVRGDTHNTVNVIILYVFLFLALTMVDFRG